MPHVPAYRRLNGKTVQFYTPHDNDRVIIDDTSYRLLTRKMIGGSNLRRLRVSWRALTQAERAMIIAVGYEKSARERKDAVSYSLFLVPEQLASNLFLVHEGPVDSWKPPIDAHVNFLLREEEDNNNTTTPAGSFDLVGIRFEYRKCFKLVFEADLSEERSSSERLVANHEVPILSPPDEHVDYKTLMKMGAALVAWIYILHWLFG